MPYTFRKLTDFSEDTLNQVFSELIDHLEAEANHVEDEAAAKVFRDRWASRKNGILPQVRDALLKNSPSELKPRLGALFNDISGRVERAIKRAETGYKQRSEIRGILSGVFLDVTLPGIRRPLGAEHPVI